MILAGVTIATLTGDNGLLQKATSAKQSNEEATALEKIKVEVAGSYGIDGKIDIENQLNQNLKRIDGLTYNNNEIDLNDVNKKITKLPATVKLNGYAFTVSEDGSVDKVVWTYNNGSYTNAETGQILNIGDTVKYETVLNKEENAIDSTKLNTLKNNLQNYSGYSSSTDNQNINRDSLTWKLLDIKDEHIRLISSAPTNKKLAFQDYNGYNNAVYFLDETCNVLYSSNIGKSKNLKIEDITEKVDKTKFDYTQFINTDIPPNMKYGEIKEYTASLKYPNIYPEEEGCKAINSITNNGKLGESEQTNLFSDSSTATNGLRVKQTSWYKAMEATDFVDSQYYSLFINNYSYWLSTRCVLCCSNRVDFYLRRVGEGIVRNFTICTSLGNAVAEYQAFAIRPVVILDNNVQLEPDGTNTWKIK